MEKELQNLGLTEKEAKVYLASLEIGRATADQLAKHTKIARPTTYLQIKSLMDKGLMSTHEEGKKTYFAPESPESLRRVLQLQREALATREGDLARLLPELSQLFQTAGERPVVRFFPGKEGIAAVREEFLKTKNKEMDVIFSINKLSKLFSEKVLDEYTSRRESLGIRSKGIYTDKSFVSSSVLTPLTERRVFPPNTLPLTVDIVIYDDKVGILSQDGFLFGLLLESEQISASMRTLFNFLWSHSEESEK